MAPAAPIDQDAIGAVASEFGRSTTLPREAYVSEELFSWEAEHLFRRQWTCIGRTGDLVAPGQIRAVVLGDESIVLTRDADGALRAFANVCRHRGHQLLTPGDAVDARLIACPYHSWTYRLDGALRSAPTFGDWAEFDLSEWPLAAVRVADWHGWCFVDRSGEAPELDVQLGNLDEVVRGYEPGRLVTGARHEYEARANWKLLAENYQECYHCPTIHPEFCRISPWDSGIDIEPTGLWCGGTMSLQDGCETMSFDGRSHGVMLPNVPDEWRRQVLYIGVFPNMLLSPHPDYVMTHVLTPLAPDRTLIVCEWLFPPDAVERPEFDASYAVDLWDLTNRQDWTACEGVQRGATSPRFRAGPLGPWEGSLHQFLSMLADAYRGGPVRPPKVPEDGRVHESS
jgi:Rieske 2Fe-2S family protein